MSYTVQLINPGFSGYNLYAPHYKFRRNNIAMHRWLIASEGRAIRTNFGQDGPEMFGVKNWTGEILVDPIIDCPFIRGFAEQQQPEKLSLYTGGVLSLL